MNRVLALSPDHVQAPDYLARARQQLKEQREREDRQRKLAEAVAAAERALRAGELDIARREVERALSIEPGDADAGRLKSQVERRQSEFREERARRHKAEQLGAEAERLLNEGDVEGADRRLREALALWSDLPNAAKLQKKIEKKLARVQTDATVAVSTLSGTRAARAPVAARPFPLKTLYLAAAMVGVVGLAAVLYYLVLRPAPPAVGPEPIPEPAPVPGPTPPDPEIARGVEAATRALEAQDFATAAREAKAVLERSSGNEEATRLLARAEESLSKIASGNRRAKELFDAGKHQEAMSVLTGVLKLAPSDPDARKLLSQLDQYARAGAEDALKQLKEAQSRAEQARAQNLAASPFEAAKALEAEGMRLYRAKQYGSATGKLFEAAEAYLRADSEARAAARAAEQERLRAAARSEAETARSRFEQARASAVSLGAEAKAAERFRQAAGLASDAQSRWAQGEFAEAKSGFEAAAEAMRRAAEEASAADAAAGQRQLDAARQAVEAAKRAVAVGDPRAAAEEASAEQLARQGRLADAVAAYRRAAAAYQAAAQRGEADRQAVQALLARYTAAFESRDLGALKTVWPALAGSEEKKIKDFFDIARTLAVELQVTEVKIAGDSASVSCRRRVEMVARDGQKVASPETGIVFGLRRRGEGWVIESVQD
jgi:tetratricopeptide (TPR) repeat protein